MTSRIRHIILAVFFAVGIVAVVLINSPRTEGNVLLAAMAPVSWVFILSYLRTPWRSTREGRAVMYLIFGLSAIITQVMFSVWVGEYPGREWIRPFAYVTVFVTLLNFELTRREGASEVARHSKALQRKIAEVREARAREDAE